MLNVIQTDVVIIGAGGAGLRAAIEVAREHPELKIALLSKVYPMRSHTVAAEVVIYTSDALVSSANADPVSSRKAIAAPFS